MALWDLWYQGSLKQDYLSITHERTFCHYTVSLRIAKCESAAVRRRAALRAPDASPAGHTLNDWNGLAVTAVAVMVSVKLDNGGITFHAFFGPVTLILNRWPSYASLTRTPYHLLTTMNFLCPSFRMLSYYRHTHTYRQTDRGGQEHYHAALWVAINVIRLLKCCLNFGCHSSCHRTKM